MSSHPPRTSSGRRSSRPRPFRPRSHRSRPLRLPPRFRLAPRAAGAGLPRAFPPRRRSSPGSRAGSRRARSPSGREGGRRSTRSSSSSTPGTRSGAAASPSSRERIGSTRTGSERSGAASGSTRSRCSGGSGSPARSRATRWWRSSTPGRPKHDATPPRSSSATTCRPPSRSTRIPEEERAALLHHVAGTLRSLAESLRVPLLLTLDPTGPASFPGLGDAGPPWCDLVTFTRGPGVLRLRALRDDARLALVERSPGQRGIEEFGGGATGEVIAWGAPSQPTARPSRNG